MMLQDQAHHLKGWFRAVHCFDWTTTTHCCLLTGVHFAFTRTIWGLQCTTVYCRVTVILHHQRCINPRGRNQMFGHWQRFSSTMSLRHLKSPLQTLCSTSAKSLFEVFISSELTQVTQTGFRGCDNKTIIVASEVLIYTHDYSFLIVWLQAHLVLVSNSWCYEFSKLTIIHCVGYLSDVCVGRSWLCKFWEPEGNFVSLLL